VLGEGPVKTCAPVAQGKPKRKLMSYIRCELQAS
jgi:hypothetical protein